MKWRAGDRGGLDAAAADVLGGCTVAEASDASDPGDASGSGNAGGVDAGDAGDAGDVDAGDTAKAGDVAEGSVVPADEPRTDGSVAEGALVDAGDGAASEGPRTVLGPCYVCGGPVVAVSPPGQHRLTALTVAIHEKCRARCATSPTVTSDGPGQTG